MAEYATMLEFLREHQAATECTDAELLAAVAAPLELLLSAQTQPMVEEFWAGFTGHLEQGPPAGSAPR